MKKKMLRFIKLGIYALLFIFIGDLIGVGFLWKVKCGNAAQETLKPVTKKILFHLYGIRNMTVREKLEILSQSEDFLEHYKGKIDSAVADKIFPDQKAGYGIDSMFVMRFHLAHGNPDLRVGYLADYADYFNPFQGISFSPFSCLDEKPESIWLFSYFNEMSHAAQFYRNPYSFEFKFLKSVPETAFHALLNWQTFELAYNHFQYEEKGSFENEAHETILKEFKKKYLDYRRVFFSDRIEHVEDQISNMETRAKKARKDSSEKINLELRVLRSTRDSLIFGPLFFHD